MIFGKELKFNSEWRLANYPDTPPVTCSPLLFSSLFNTDFFMKRYFELYKDNKNPGIITNQENILLREFAQREQLNIIESNGKFNIPKEVIVDIWEDCPDKDSVFIYYMIILGIGGFHKVAVLQTKDKFYYIDTNNKTSFVYDHFEFIEKFSYNLLTNLSVLVNPTLPEFVEYKKDDFLHIIIE